MIGDPTSAPPRADLTFLRRRARPRVAAPPAAGAAPAAATAAPAAPPASRSRIDYTHHGQHPAPPAAAPPPASPPGAPAAARSSLDLDEPPTPPQPTSARPAPTQPAVPAQPHPIDFSRPGRSSSLDLSDPPRPDPASAPRGLPRPEPARRPDLRGARVAGRGQHLLTRSAPTAVLTRVQSGVGHLTVEARLPETAGDFRLAALYQLRSGGSSVVALSLGRRFAPPSSRRPVLVAGHEDHDEQIALDLRQIRDLQRLAVVGFAESRMPLTWGGTLVVTTYAGARIELPLESLYAGTTAVLLSLYNVGGQLVARAEMETISGDLRQAARAYGYDRITWRDDRMPVD